MAVFMQLPNIQLQEPLMRTTSTLTYLDVRKGCCAHDAGLTRDKPVVHNSTHLVC
jgi:hypothetical protein